jgi:hypothetical protein
MDQNDKLYFTIRYEPNLFGRLRTCYSTKDLEIMISMLATVVSYVPDHETIIHI